MSANPHEVLDRLYDSLDDMADDLEAYDRAIASFPVEACGTQVLVGLLSITRPYRDRLPARAQLVERVESALQRLAPDRVDALMSGLR